MIETFGSVCSGIEAAHFAFTPFGIKQVWSSEIAEFPSSVLAFHYPEIPNLGDMRGIVEKLKNGVVETPDLFCGGTPCQSFSLAGWKAGLDDERGQLSMTFIDIADEIDRIRLESGKKRSIILWENVEGVLRNRTNPFGNFISGLAGFDAPLDEKWGNAGLVIGPKRKVAWRVLDAKYFGVPQQRKRLYVVAASLDEFPENALFEEGVNEESLAKIKLAFPKRRNNRLDLFNDNEADGELKFSENGNRFEVFREYTDCLYAAYGTKWNGNAAAHNGSLFVAQNGLVRRLSPLECERLMGFPDGYTDIPGSRRTSRYQATGNSWAIPVVRWIGERLLKVKESTSTFEGLVSQFESNVLNLKEPPYFRNGKRLNISNSPNRVVKGSLEEIVSASGVSDKIYISVSGAKGVLRRHFEKGNGMNERLKDIWIQYIGESELDNRPPMS